jgi:hypothetical protein
MKTRNNRKQEKEPIVDDKGVVCTEVRLLPYGGGGNIIVGRASYDIEIAYRKKRIREGVHYDLPSWENLKIYNPE